MRRRLILVFLVALILCGTAGVVVATTGSEAPVAEKPVADDPKAALFVAADGDDDRDCRTQAEPCATLNRAYIAAQPGEIVEVAAGTYPEQQIVADPSKTSRRHVIMRPAKGAEVTLGGLTLGSGPLGDGPRHLTVERMTMAYATPNQQLPASALPGTTDVVLRGIDAGNFSLWGVRDVRVEGGDWGPCFIGAGAKCGHSRIDSGPLGFDTDGVTIDGARFHDYRFSDACMQGEDCHFECMYVNGSANVTIRNSTLRDCALFDIFVTLSGPDAARVGHRNLKIIGNVLDTPWDENRAGPARARASAVVLDWCQNSPLGYEGVDIAYNSFQSDTGVMVDEMSDCRMENVRVVGNLLAWDGCDPRWTYAYNVWSSELRQGRCAPNERIAGPQLPYQDVRSGADLDVHLKAGRTPADDFVPVDAAPRCPTRDIDGHKRPRKAPCDAGADDRK